MIRPPSARLASAILGLLVFAGPPRSSADEAPQPAANPGRFFSVVETIDNQVFERVQAGSLQVVAQSAVKGVRPTLIYEFRNGEQGPSAGTFGSAYDLADFLSTKLGGALTVAYVPEPLSGYAALAALACDEIVMGPNASIGPSTPGDQTVKPAVRDPIRFLAIRKQRDPDLLLGMLDDEADLRAVRTADNQVHYVLAENLPAFRKTHAIASEAPAWEGGARGVLTAERARQEGFSKLTAEHVAEVLAAYRLNGQSTADDPTLGQVIKPAWIRIEGPLDTIKASYLMRRIEQARAEGVNLLFFQIDSEGGIVKAADDVADRLVSIKGMKTVAYIDDRAMGVSTLVALACDDIVFGKDARIGDVRQIVTGRNGSVIDLEPGEVLGLAKSAEAIAAKKGHPAAIARAMIDPESVVYRAKDSKTGAVGFVLASQIEAEPGRYLDAEIRKDRDKVLTISSADAEAFGVGQVIADKEELKGLYGLRGKPIREDGPTWVDGLVTTLNDPFVSWVLLFVGMFMLILELKLPGIGLPAITSALAFLLFFWSRYLSGTADQLEIMLFLVGMVCLALELFVFPGFGVFGMSGILLILVSVVMASHTFVWPTQEYEYRQMSKTLIQLTAVLFSVGGGAIVVGRYLPSLPIFNRMVLKPELYDPDVAPTEKPAAGGEAGSLFFLVGETGRTTTVLRPSGKARFGDLLVDVDADGFYVDPDRLVEVVEVRGAKVIVKQVG